MVFLLIKSHQTSQLNTINTRKRGNTNKQNSLLVNVFNIRLYKMLSLTLLNWKSEREVNVSGLKMQNKIIKNGLVLRRCRLSKLALQTTSLT